MGKASRRKTANRTKDLLKVTESRLNAWGVDSPVVIRADLPQEQKISNAIGKILDSEVSEDGSFDEYQQLANAIVLAWNTSLLEPEGQAEVLQGLKEFVELRDPSGAPAALELVAHLMEKKRDMFPDDKRFIVSHDLRLVGKIVHVTAAAVAKPPQMPPAP